jgi:hypothetical protein
MNEDQAKFEGYAIVDVLGHQRYAGFVRTEAYGQVVMFRVDVPGLPAREHTLTEPQYATEVEGVRRWCPVGTKVQRPPTLGFTKLIGAGSIYSISPCDEAAAMAAVEASQRAEFKLISLPERKALAAPDHPEPADADDTEDDEDEEPEDDDDYCFESVR